MLVGTVAALQEESGQMRHEWKSDVARLENELQQLRSAAAMALPNVRTETTVPLEANMRLLSHAPGTDSCSSISGRDAAALQVQAMLTERALSERAMSERAMSTRSLPQHNHTLSNSGLPSFVPDVSEGYGPGALAREAAQLEAVMQQSSVRARAGRDQFADASMLPRGRPESQGTNLAEAVRRQMSTAAMVDSLARASSDKESNSGKEASDQSRQIRDLYVELERMTVALQEKEQENSRLKEEKDTSVNAHSRDIAALEAMLQQLSADNKSLSQQLAQANAKLQQYQINGLDPEMIMKLKQQCSSLASTPTSYCSASIEHRSVSDIDSSSSTVELDRLKLKLGLR
jgi:hypothetical protein